MDRRITTNKQQELTDSLSRWLAGFLGALVAVFVFPKFLRFALRKYAFRVLAEILAIVTLGLLAEKAADWAAQPRPVVPSGDGRPVADVEAAIAS